MNESASGPQWDETPEQQEGFREFFGSASEWVHMTDGVEMSRSVKAISMQSDGTAGRTIERNMKNAITLSCSHAVTDGMVIRRTPGGLYICADCWSRCNGRCGQPFEPDEDRVYLSFLKALVHRECGLEIIRRYLQAHKMGKVQIEEGERIRLSVIYQDILREHRRNHPGLLQRAWAALTSGGTSTDVAIR